MVRGGWPEVLFVGIEVGFVKFLWIMINILWRLMKHLVRLKAEVCCSIGRYCKTIKSAVGRP